MKKNLTGYEFLNGSVLCDFYFFEGKTQMSVVSQKMSLRLNSLPTLEARILNVNIMVCFYKDMVVFNVLFGQSDCQFSQFI